VILVGAGPGDPGLLTLRGAEVLRAADVVLHDELVDPAVLDLAPPGAERINVGKRGHDAPTRSQHEINALMVKLARRGRTVVRLKGGDPYVFGRGGEEASHCAAAGVAFEVVPGVSSATGVLAHAGIPVTDRRHAASFAVVTGHRDPTEVTAATRWDALATAVDTLVILMGMRTLPSLVARLLAAGRAPDTPAAAVQWGTTPRQRTVVAPLSELVERVEQAGLGTPSVVVVGEVVRLREELAWFERLPLFGRRVLVTRPSGQSAELAAAIRALGGQPVEIPTIRIEPAGDLRPLDAALDGLERYDVLLFASANAVAALAERARARGIALGGRGLRVACVGARTAEAAAREGLGVELVPERSDGEGLAAALVASLPPAGLRFLLPRSEIGRDALPDALRAAGAQVDAVAAYRTVAAGEGGDELCRRLEAGELHALTFTSPSTVASFLAMLRPAAREAAGRCLVAAVGETTAAALREAGLPAQVVARSPDARALAEALAAHVAGRSADPAEGRPGAPPEWPPGARGQEGS
jgi:uroporphyrinogen III methyltransferase/synthase